MISNDARVYYSLHLTSMLLSLFLIIVYRKNNNKNQLIVCYSVTLLLASIVSGIIGLSLGAEGNGMTLNRTCKCQALLFVYITYSLTIWPICMEFKTWKQLKNIERRINNNNNNNSNNNNNNNHNHNNRNNRNNDNNNENNGNNNENNNGNNENNRKRRDFLLIWCIVIAWLLPMLMTFINWLLGSLDLWSYHCMISINATYSIFGMFLMCVIATIITLMISICNIFLIRNRNNNNCLNTRINDDILTLIKEISLHARVIIFGIITSIILMAFFVIKSIQILDNLSYTSITTTWTDFLLVVLPYITFLIFGTTKEASQYYTPICFKRTNTISLVDQFSTINPNLRKPCEPHDEDSIISFTTRSHTTASSLEGSLIIEMQDKVYSPQIKEKYKSGSPGPSTFSQRMNPISPDPFIHRKNPPLTIKVFSCNSSCNSSCCNSNRNSSCSCNSNNNNSNNSNNSSSKNSSIGNRSENKIRKNKGSNVLQRIFSSYESPLRSNRKCERRKESSRDIAIHYFNKKKEIDSYGLNVISKKGQILESISFEPPLNDYSNSSSSTNVGKNEKNASLTKSPITKITKKSSLPCIEIITPSPICENLLKTFNYLEEEKNNEEVAPPGLTLPPQRRISKRKKPTLQKLKADLNITINDLDKNHKDITENEENLLEAESNINIITTMTNNNSSNNIITIDENKVYDSTMNLPVTPSFGTMSEAAQKTTTRKKSNAESISSSRSSNNSRNSYLSGGGGDGLTLTPRCSLPLNMLNRQSVIERIDTAVNKNNRNNNRNNII
ncbi:hypothetical protein Glove_357g20 [Diversispora epigaea]|uniref:G-protein coupled receptors family 2 profile 2 domain-containing protein n=1 Tax=Diversispora epigaea TaxID=1348612 RepID=A0A397HAQ5_9GLOM|nr:hypothetical protein Glove_357g20 [Diversispora epigaea]